MIIAAFLLIVAIDIVAAKYILKVREVNNSKCEFIEGIASEIKIPLINLKSVDFPAPLEPTSP